MSEDEAITVYSFFIVAQGLFGGKCSTKPDIRPLPDYTKWNKKSLQKGLGYNIKNMLDPIHRNINMTTAMQYQYYSPLRVLVTEMVLKDI